MGRSEEPIRINSLTEVHRRMGLPKPRHPLLSLVDLDAVKELPPDSRIPFALNFYAIAVKEGYTGRMQYGQQDYDFSEGTMTFLAPGQVIALESAGELRLSGWWLLFHPDFLHGHALALTIRSYGFFGYAVHEALHLSGKERETIDAIVHSLSQECQASIDGFSQDVMLAHLELLLNYSNRFYHRQFLTRKAAGSDLLGRFEELLERHFESDQASRLPTVKQLADRLHVSPDYLGDLLRTLTGRSTQQHIQDRLIERSKVLLSTTTLSVGEIAYRFGFEHPQSFHRLFKRKTLRSPQDFRKQLRTMRP